jgi:carbon-monoxide dehydrogenase iron sulfur subunit
MKMGKTIIINVERCLACKSCELACAVAHSKSKVLEDAVTELPRPQRRVTVEAFEEFGVPMQCRHCENAPCITVCPTKAIHRQHAACPERGRGEGPVLIDHDLCIGCKYCLMVCPFGVIDVSSDGKVMVKCDLCFERAKQGQEPACVEACSTKALRFADEKEFINKKRQKAAKEFVVSIKENRSKEKHKENTR